MGTPRLIGMIFHCHRGITFLGGDCIVKGLAGTLALARRWVRIASWMMMMMMTSSMDPLFLQALIVKLIRLTVEVIDCSVLLGSGIQLLLVLGQFEGQNRGRYGLQSFLKDGSFAVVH